MQGGAVAFGCGQRLLHLSVVFAMQLRHKVVAAAVVVACWAPCRGHHYAACDSVLPAHVLQRNN